MTINRHNYETYFLLYLDKELSVKDINALHLFLQGNADLKTELDLLQRSILHPEKIVFTKKEGLLKKLNISKIQEDNLLFFIDGELMPEQIKKLQGALVSDEKLSAELLILQQTKLIPDRDIIFLNKPSLYKKEKDRVISFGWMKLAVAALFIGFGVWGTSLYFNTKNTTDTYNRIAILKVAANREKKVTEQIPVKNTDAIIDKSIANKTSPADNSAIGLVKNKVMATGAPRSISTPFVTNENLTTPKKIIIKASTTLTKSYVEPVDKIDEESVVSITAAMQKINEHLPSFTANNNKIEPTRSINTNVLYTSSIADNDNENIIDHFTLSENEPKKNRLTGLLRKAKRILERTTNFDNGDNNIKVANLAFTTH